ncbi:hypothetical protein QZH41_008480 [Actinostola sp. cb2023]|nr:hypothetical protein QZH41_008480 [Actinostola sp. cb2023]
MALSLTGSSTFRCCREFDEQRDQNEPVRKMSKTEQPKLFPVDLVKSYYDINNDVEEELELLKDSLEGVHCGRCGLLLKVDEHLSNIVRHIIFDEYSPGHRVLLLRCDGGGGHIAAVRVAQKWWSVEEMLSSYDVSRNGLEDVRTFGERLVLSILNGIVFNQHERMTDDPTFGHHPPNETAKLMWHSGKAIGFYSIKQKGKLISYFSPDVWTINVLDTIFVRKACRKRGLATKMVEDFLQSFPNQDVGFSSPLGKTIKTICLKILSRNTENRDRIWECWEPGGMYGRINLWLSLKTTAKGNSDIG